jgi:NADPH:quinone reductase-like Zn-dependent oxidoreductase
MYGYAERGGPETQAFFDVSTPEPGPGQLLVANRAAGVNPVDWKLRSGMYGSSEPLVGPVGLGVEVSGVVEGVGEGVEGFVLGDEVFGTVAGGGGYAEYSLLSTASTARKPDGISFVDAATLPVAAATAYDGVVQLDLPPGATLLVVGAGGGVGIATVQIAKDRGLVVVGTASEAKRELLESFGVIHVASGAGVVERIRAVSPSGIDAIYDLVGGDALREVAVLVDDPSRIISGGDMATVTELGGTMVARARSAEVLDEVAALVVRGALDPTVTEVFPFDRAGEALARVEGGHATGKVVITIS